MSKERPPRVLGEFWRRLAQLKQVKPLPAALRGTRWLRRAARFLPPRGPLYASRTIQAVRSDHTRLFPFLLFPVHYFLRNPAPDSFFPLGRQADGSPSVYCMGSSGHKAPDYM